MSRDHPFLQRSLISRSNFARKEKELSQSSAWSLRNLEIVRNSSVTTGDEASIPTVNTHLGGEATSHLNGYFNQLSKWLITMVSKTPTVTGVIPFPNKAFKWIYNIL